MKGKDRKMKNRKEMEEKIHEDPDYIAFPRFGNSLKRFVSSYPEGVDNKTIAKLLLLEVDEVDALFESAIGKIRKNLKIKPSDME